MKRRIIKSVVMGLSDQNWSTVPVKYEFCLKYQLFKSLKPKMEFGLCAQQQPSCIMMPLIRRGLWQLFIRCIPTCACRAKISPYDECNTMLQFIMLMRIYVFCVFHVTANSWMVFRSTEHLVRNTRQFLQMKLQNSTGPIFITQLLFYNISQ